MNKTSKFNWLNIKNVIVVVAGIGVMYSLVTVIINNHFKDIELGTRLLIANQQALLVAIAETTARNGADQITESIIIDCSVAERSQFDSLLNQLNNRLNNAELTELERLFGRCGKFRSDTKSVMVTKLAREIEVFESYVNQLELVLGESVSEEYKLSLWQSLADEEQKQSDLFATLVRLQDQIISTLLAGSAVDSSEITDILVEVRSVQEALTVTATKTSSIRSDLISI
ncbi:MAG: hypothetical protein H6782_04730 [Candidatus Nomurabacteria bacterium]|nr:MAG: hypothetical protein H6782_04730 [Candidatus Nomurabacteria bacterium]